MIGIILGIIFIIVSALFCYCALILDSWLEDEGLKYHYYDYEEGDINGETDTR